MPDKTRDGSALTSPLAFLLGYVAITLFILSQASGTPFDWPARILSACLLLSLPRAILRQIREQRPQTTLTDEAVLIAAQGHMVAWITYLVIPYHWAYAIPVVGAGIAATTIDILALRERLATGRRR